MTPALTPALALDYLTALSADIRAGVVLASDGDLLAGAAELAGPARELLAAAEIASAGADDRRPDADRDAAALEAEVRRGGADRDAAVLDAGQSVPAAAREYVEAEVTTTTGGVYAARSDRHAVVVVTGRFALSALARYDLRVVLGELDGVRVAA